MENVAERKWMDIIEGEVRYKVKEIKNWKAPGMDGVQNYWLKYLTMLITMLTEVINKIIKESDLAPKWLAEGKTTLIFKKGNKNQAKNYRPICCRGY